MGLVSKVFENFRVAADNMHYKVNKGLFEKQINAMLNRIIQTEESITNSTCRVFDAFKKNFDAAKQAYETNPEYVKREKQGWRNFTDLMVKATKNLHEQCNYFDNDVINAMAVEDSVRQLKNIWKNIAESYKARLNQDGIMLEGYDCVCCKSIVIGISKATRPSDIKSDIVNQHIRTNRNLLNQQPH